MEDPQTLLDLVDAAIKARLSGTGAEEYSIGSERFRYTSLGQLQQMRKELQAEVAAAGGPQTSTIIRAEDD